MWKEGSIGSIVIRNLTHFAKIINSYVLKNWGPNNRFDLSEESQKINESLAETLKREIIEETDYQVVNYSNVRCYDAFVTDKSKRVHHIFVLYDIILILLEVIG